MNLFKRVTINITRQPGKTGLLLVLIFILGVFTSGAISVKNAIYKIEESLLMRMPAISSIGLNEVAAAYDAGVSLYELRVYHRELLHANRPTSEDISAVGSLPYVQVYDARLMSRMYSNQNLMWAYFDIDRERLPFELREVFIGGSRSDPDFDVYVESFLGSGVKNPNLTDIDTGLITLVSGRTFTQEEIDNGEMVAVVSRRFAQMNHLSVGGVIELENIAFNTDKMMDETRHLYASWYAHDERFHIAHRVLEFEIIGLFDVCHEFIYDTFEVQYNLLLSAVLGISNLHNRIYMPLQVVEDILIFENEAILDFLDEMDDVSPNFYIEEPRLNAFFVLHDPRDLENFGAAAAELLPGFWEVFDFRIVDNFITSSMTSLIQIADFIQWGTAIASVIILTLVIVLFLRDRRYEIGIYMALGDKLSRVIIQILIEVGLTAIIAISLSLVAGNTLSNNISRNMLEQSLIQHTQEGGTVWEYIMWGPGQIPPILFSPGELTIDEVIEMYDVSLDSRIVMVFFIMGSGVAFLSALIPVLYIVRLEPKKILL